MVYVSKVLKTHATFLFSCPSYVNCRATLLNVVGDIVLKNNLDLRENELKLYLYGHSSINDSDNRDILLCMIKYIKETNRFS